MVIISDNQKPCSSVLEDDIKTQPHSDGHPLSGDKDIRTLKNIPIGSQYSAFSGLVRAHETSYFMHELRDGFLLKPPIHSQYFPMELYGGRREFPPELPIAPAFAQILQRRRRRENRPRRQRTTFTSDQTLKLELEYNRADYITRPRRFELAETLNLTESQIKIWFQNRRAKDKRIEKAQMDHQLRSIGFPNFAGTNHSGGPHQSTCGVCAVPVPLPLPLGPIPWSSVNT